MPPRRRVEAPLEDVAIDDRRAGNVTLSRALVERPDVDEQRPRGQLLSRPSCFDADQSRPSARQELVDIPGSRFAQGCRSIVSE
jgi:hypothetical protein